MQVHNKTFFRNQRGRKMRTEFTVFVIKQDPKVQVKWPDGITIAEQSVKMRKTAIKNNIKNIKRAYWKEK